MTDAPPPRGAGEDRLRILCLGGTAVDHVFGVDAIPARPIKVQAISYLERCDGVAAMAACAIAARGHAVRFWGRFGADANGRRLAERLARAGIELDAAGSRTAGRTATAAAIVDAAGRRLVARFRGAGLDDDPGWLALADHPLAPAGDPGGWFHGAFVIAIARGATGAEALAIATAAAADRPAPGTKFSPA
jgi:sugar/nucleoside kinase (ribokinase family)